MAFRTTIPTKMAASSTTPVLRKIRRTPLLLLPRLGLPLRILPQVGSISSAYLRWIHGRSPNVSVRRLTPSCAVGLHRSQVFTHFAVTRAFTLRLRSFLKRVRLFWTLLSLLCKLRVLLLTPSLTHLHSSPNLFKDSLVFWRIPPGHPSALTPSKPSAPTFSLRFATLFTDLPTFLDAR